jgi:hypothetical protein
MDCLEWVRRALETPGLSLVPLTPEIAVESTRLPGNLHADPADRILVATARNLGACLMTRDQALLDYGRKRHARIVSTRVNLYLLPVQLFAHAIAAVSIALASSLWWLAAVLLAYGIATLVARGIGLRHRPDADAALPIAERADAVGAPGRAHGLRHRAP